MHASNFSLRIMGNNEEQLDAALLVALDDQKIRSWQEIGDWFVLYWSKEIDNVHALPFAEGIESVRYTVKNWLKEDAPASDQPDIDGTVSVGAWVLVAGDASFNEKDCNYYEVLRIRRGWAVYSK